MHLKLLGNKMKDLSPYCQSCYFNGALFLGATMYESTSLVVTWSVFAVVCFISMGVMFGMVKWLERVAK